jgi:hypothetical protein
LISTSAIDDLDARMLDTSSMQSSELPALFRAADAASIAIKTRFLKRMRADLALLVIGGFISSISWTNEAWHAGGNITAAILLIGSMYLTVLVKMQKDEGQWYDARAIAESVKSLTWQYMACAAPFGCDMKADVADKLLIEKFGELLRGRKGMFKELSTHASPGEGDEAQISEKMRSIRESTLAVRHEFYLRHRVRDQSRWYHASSASAGLSGSKWFYFIAGAQFLAAAAAILSAKLVDFTRLVACVSAAAAAGISWSQLNKFDEVAESYGVAACDLTLILSLSKHISDEKSFGEFVQDAEKAISREHTLWVARRGVA